MPGAQPLFPPLNNDSASRYHFVTPDRTIRRLTAFLIHELSDLKCIYEWHIGCAAL
jgi:hypothetical protein